MVLGEKLQMNVFQNLKLTEKFISWAAIQTLKLLTAVSTQQYGCDKAYCYATQHLFVK